MVSAAESFSVGVSDMAAALRLFRDEMKLTVEADYPASSSLLAAWKLAPGVSARIVELSYTGYPIGRLRLVEYTPSAMTRVRVHSGAGPHDGAVDIGPKAIDFYVADPIRPVFERITALGYPVRSEPVKHSVGETVSEEFVFWGPDGVPLLFMVGHVHGPEMMRPDLRPDPFSEVATVSVIGGATDRTRDFSEGILGLVPIVAEDTGADDLARANELTGVPEGTGISWIVYGASNEASGKILVLNFGGSEGKRLSGRMRPGHLGFSLITHRTEDIDALYRKLVDGGWAVMTAPTEVEANGTTSRRLLAHGPNEELFEIVQ